MRIRLNSWRFVTLSVLVFALLIGCPLVAPPDGSNGNGDVIKLSLVAEGLVAPLGMVSPPDGSNRLFVLDQIGTIRIIEGGDLLSAPFLDLADRLVDIMPAYDERGLLGMAFHPQYAANGRFFVVYNAPPTGEENVGYEVDSIERVSEFQVSSDPNRADLASERILLELAKPQFNHNGGHVAFGPEDGFLYISIGDGGGANDDEEGHNPEIGNGQDKSTLFGKMLRIDVNGGEPYEIPPDNPFVDDPEARPEIWALGLRNPWRFSFDRDQPSRMFIADVGQDLFEEVSLGIKGANYGWFYREGAHCFSPASPTEPPSNCPLTGADGEPLVDPLFDYSHLNDSGEVFRTSIIGGFLYRGDAIPGLAGQYVFGDYSAGFEGGDGTLLAAREATDGSWEIRELTIDGSEDGRIHRFVRGFGEGEDGELYVLTTISLGPEGTTGEVFKLVPASP